MSKTVKQTKKPADGDTRMTCAAPFNTTQSALSGRGHTSAQIHDALAGGYSPFISDSSAEVKAIAADAIASTLTKVYIMSAVAGAAILVAGALMRWERVKMA